VALERLRRQVVLPGLAQRARHRERTRAGQAAQKTAGGLALELVTFAQRRAQARARHTLVGFDLEDLLVEFDREVVVAAANGLIGLLDLLGEIHRNVPPG